MLGSLNQNGLVIPGSFAAEDPSLANRGSLSRDNDSHAQGSSVIRVAAISVARGQVLHFTEAAAPSDTE